MLVIASLSFHSCIDDIDESIKEPSRYNDVEIQSYADLFEVFWNIMDQKYNYFYEQKDMDWDQIYKEFHPKFEALKTFNQFDTYSSSELQADCDKAEEYFKDIIDPIIDRHFRVVINLPISRFYRKELTFYGGMKNETPTYIYSFQHKYKSMTHKVDPETAVFAHEKKPVDFQEQIFGVPNNLIGGALKTNPDIYYFSFQQFILSNSYVIRFKDKYLSVDTKSSFYLTVDSIRNSEELKAISDEQTRKILFEKSSECLNRIDAFMQSPLIKETLAGIETFKETDELTDDFLRIINQFKKEAPDPNIEKRDLSFDDTFKQNPGFRNWFFGKLDNHVTVATEYNLLVEDIAKIAGNKAIIDLYRNFFNPLKKGEISKLILDLRGNGGGLVRDARLFTDRLITKDAIFAYQRFKEDNNRFSYTPWVPARTHVSPLSMSKEIPIAILVDAGSASMSEISTLMLKSQGDHVTIVGHHSAGATAGLGDSDQFNGGSRDNVTKYMRFFMPLLATKDANEQVVEGVGIKPDFELEPLTKDEVYDMAQNPENHVDKTLNKAIEVLSNK